jgi:Recombination endonuclease VII
MAYCSKCRREPPEVVLYRQGTYSYRCQDCNSDYFAAYQRRKREELIQSLGGKCACCGESEIKFLAVDHVNGKAQPERQVLCHNCNLAKGFYGQCPHPNGVTGGPRSGRPRTRP